MDSLVFTDNKVQLNLINTNARSLQPKSSSLIRCFLNLTLTFAIITETWLHGGTRLELETERLLLGHGLRMHALSREPLASGVCYGGLAIICREACTKSSVLSFPNPDKFEVLPTMIKVSDVKRKIFAIAAYIPPNYTVGRGRQCLQHISNLVLSIKNRFTDPLIVVAGDFNQWDIPPPWPNTVIFKSSD